MVTTDFSGEGGNDDWGVVSSELSLDRLLLIDAMTGFESPLSPSA